MGGVPKDGIPDLINPPAVTPQDAWYMNPTDRVFGISINGEHRAYPLRILNPMRWQTTFWATSRSLWPIELSAVLESCIPQR